MNKKILIGAIASLFVLGAGCISTTKTAAGPLGIFRSSDKGATWQSINVLPTKDGIKSLTSAKVYKVYPDPNDDNAMYMATRDQGLFLSLDHGDSWQMVPEFKGKFIYAVAIDPTNKCQVFVTDGTSIYRTDDCTRTWRIIYSESGRKVIGINYDYGNHNFVYAATENGVVLASQNSGNSWRALKDFRYVIRQISVDPATPGRIYVATSQSGLWKSEDYGENWTKISDPLVSYSEGLYFYRLVLDSGRKDSIYWISKYGIFHSPDAGKTWEDLKLVTSPGSVNIYNFAVNPANPSEMYYTGTVIGANNAATSKLYKSTDGGQSWSNSKLPSTYIPSVLFLDQKNPKLLYVGFTTPVQQTSAF